MTDEEQDILEIEAQQLNIGLTNFINSYAVDMKSLSERNMIIVEALYRSYTDAIIALVCSDHRLEVLQENYSRASELIKFINTEMGQNEHEH